MDNKVLLKYYGKKFRPKFIYNRKPKDFYNWGHVGVKHWRPYSLEYYFVKTWKDKTSWILYYLAYNHARGDNKRAEIIYEKFSDTRSKVNKRYMRKKERLAKNK